MFGVSLHHLLVYKKQIVLIIQGEKYDVMIVGGEL